MRLRFGLLTVLLLGGVITFATSGMSVLLSSWGWSARVVSELTCEEGSMCTLVSIKRESENRLSPLQELAFAGNGTFIAGTNYNEVAIWRLSGPAAAQRSARWYTCKYNGATRASAFAVGNSRIAVECSGTVRTWTPTGEHITTYEHHTQDSVYGMSFGGDGTHLITTDSDATINIWNTETGGLETSHQLTPNRSASANDILGMTTAGNGTHLALLSHAAGVRNTARITVWEIPEMNKVSDIEYTAPGYGDPVMIREGHFRVNTFAFTKHSEELLFGTTTDGENRKGVLNHLDIANGKIREQDTISEIAPSKLTSTLKNPLLPGTIISDPEDRYVALSTFEPDPNSQGVRSLYLLIWDTLRESLVAHRTRIKNGSLNRAINQAAWHPSGDALVLEIGRRDPSIQDPDIVARLMLWEIK